MTEAKVQQKNIVRCRLLMENLLEDLCVHYDRKMPVIVEMKHRLTSRVLRFQYQGDPYNPIQKEEKDEWTEQLMSHIGLIPGWNYRQGVNELTLRLPGDGIGDEMWIILAFGASILLGLAGTVLPETVLTVLGEYVFASFSSLFMNLLGTFAGIMVFLSVISGICGVGSAADFSKMGRYLIIRNLLITFVGSGVFILAVLPFFSFRFGLSGQDSQMAAVVDLLLHIVPENPISPFMDGNMIQIVFMGVFIGMVLEAKHWNILDYEKLRS